MWSYERRLQYPVNIKQTNPKLAMVIMSQFGGPDGELGEDKTQIGSSSPSVITIPCICLTTLI